MQVPVELANKVLSVLEHENFYDAASALKIALILLPVKPNSLKLPDGTLQAHGESVVEEK